MKEIHFSLPPMRSSSMSDLGHADADDSDHEYIESLIPVNTHSQRSNSFSKYPIYKLMKKINILGPKLSIN